MRTNAGVRTTADGHHTTAEDVRTTADYCFGRANAHARFIFVYCVGCGLRLKMPIECQMDKSALLKLSQSLQERHQTLNPASRKDVLREPTRLSQTTEGTIYIPQ